MKDKEIRSILIEWIRANHGKVRIYQEKSIEGSICDVMAVTDHLIGFEIKSDADNFERFERQERSYSATFDENYLVVGERLFNAYPVLISYRLSVVNSIQSFRYGEATCRKGEPYSN